MQKEALQRVHDMHKRSQEMVRGVNQQDFNKSSSQETSYNNQNQPYEQNINQFQNNSFNNNQSDRQRTSDNSFNSNHNQTQQFSNPLQGLLNGNLFGNKKQSSDSKGLLSSLLDGFDIDEEKAMIGLLIYILAKNGSDVKLLLALGYLLL